MTEAMKSNAASDEARKFKQVGSRPIRHDGLDKVTGRAQFGADFSLPGQLSGAIARSPHAHARIRSIDTAAAEAMPGVRAVVTAADLGQPKSVWRGTPEQGTDAGELAANVLAQTKVLYHGHAVAAVAASSVAEARAACEAIVVDYEVLPPVLSIDAAMAEDAPILHEGQEAMGFEDPATAPRNTPRRIHFGRGDLDAAFDRAEVVLEGEFEIPMVHQGYIEPHACLATTRENGKIDIWCSTQGPFAVKASTAAVLGVPASEIKVTPTEIGGGFGGKTTVYLEPIAAALSRKAGRPVKMVMSREEVFRATGPTSGSRTKMRIGALRDGTLVAADVQIVFESGSFRGSPVGAACMTVIGPYTFEAFSIEGLDVVLNKPKVAAYRAPGAPNVAFATESLIDELAIQLNRDPIDLRLQNAVQEGDRAPYGPKFKRIGLRETLEAARAHPHYAAPLGENQGRGVAVGFWFNAGLQSSATVSVDEDGSAVVRTGNPDIGGSRASLAMMVAEELGINSSRIRPLVGDTDSVGYCDMTGGSRVTYATGMAVIEAARLTAAHLCARAATIWGVEVDDVVWQDGHAVLRSGAAGETKSLALAEIAREMRATGGPIVASASVNPPAAGPGFGVHICDLEVDPETGPQPGGALHRSPGRRQSHPPELCRRPAPGRRRPGHRLVTQRGLSMGRPGPHREPRIPGLPHPGGLGSADDRHRHHRGAQPAASLRRPRRR